MGGVNTGGGGGGGVSSPPMEASSSFFVSLGLIAGGAEAMEDAADDPSLSSMAEANEDEALCLTPLSGSLLPGPSGPPGPGADMMSSWLHFPIHFGWLGAGLGWNISESCPSMYYGGCSTSNLLLHLLEQAAEEPRLKQERDEAKYV